MHAETDRIFVDQLKDTDSDFILQLLNTAGWKQFIGDRNVNTNAEAQAYIAKIKNTSDITYWVVFNQADKSPMGIITYIKRDHLEHHDLGFAFLPEFMGKGYAMEACRYILNMLNSTSSAKTLLAIVKSSNRSSIRLLEKLGFLPDENTQVDEPDLKVYILLS